MAEKSKSTVPRRRRKRRTLVVRGELHVANTVLPWERDLLLPVVLQVVADLLPNSDKESKP